MDFQIRLGEPTVKNQYDDLNHKKNTGTLSKHEDIFFRKLLNTLRHLSHNPRHPGLHSHDIDSLSREAGLKIFESYLENDNPSAGRVFWAYGPDKNEITVMAIEPHHPNKSKAYRRIHLSGLFRRNR